MADNNEDYNSDPKHVDSPCEQSSQPCSVYLDGRKDAVDKVAKKSGNIRPHTQKEIMPQSEELSASPPNDTDEKPNPADTPQSPVIPTFGSESDKSGHKEDRDLKPPEKPGKTEQKKKKHRSDSKPKGSKKSTKRKSSGKADSANADSVKREAEKKIKKTPSFDNHLKHVKKTTSRKKENRVTEENAETKPKLESKVVKKKVTADGAENPDGNNEALNVEKQGIPVKTIHIAGGKFLFENSHFIPYRIVTKEEWESCKDKEACAFVALLRKESETKPPQDIEQPKENQADLQTGVLKKSKSRQKRSKERVSPNDIANGGESNQPDNESKARRKLGTLARRRGTEKSPHRSKNGHRRGSKDITSDKNSSNASPNPPKKEH